MEKKSKDIYQENSTLSSSLFEEIDDSEFNIISDKEIKPKDESYHINNESNNQLTNVDSIPDNLPNLSQNYEDTNTMSNSDINNIDTEINTTIGNSQFDNESNDDPLLKDRVAQFHKNLKD